MKCITCGTILPEGQPFCLNEPMALRNSKEKSHSLCYKDYLILVKLETSMDPEGKIPLDHALYGDDYKAWYKANK